jgi:hypothetical protein
LQFIQHKGIFPYAERIVFKQPEPGIFAGRADRIDKYPYNSIYGRDSVSQTFAGVCQFGLLGNFENIPVDRNKKENQYSREEEEKEDIPVKDHPGAIHQRSL